MARLNVEAINGATAKIIPVLQLGSLPPAVMEQIVKAGRLQVFLDVLKEIKEGKLATDRVVIGIE